MSIETISIIVLFVSFFGLLAYGVPVAYAIGISTMATLVLNIAFMPSTTTVSQRMTTGIDNFALLAIPFRSYSQPILIMAAIPFGMVGAIAGHLIMGFSLSMLSIFGVVALSGVVINDSLLLIDQVNRNRREGKPLFEAVINSGMRRFRPILLTSLTTFFGLMPMIFETSVQAQFLIPMAISLGFGIMFATGITLLLIPTLYMILEDIRKLFGLKEMAVNES